LADHRIQRYVRRLRFFRAFFPNTFVLGHASVDISDRPTNSRTVRQSEPDVLDPGPATEVVEVLLAVSLDEARIWDARTLQ
jgi:hypothetical protein